MIDKLTESLYRSKTAYHAVAVAQEYLLAAGFEKLEETAAWQIKKGGKYFVVRDGSAMVAFKVGEGFSFPIVASHTDSPCFKIKLNGENSSAGCTRINVEKYGGLLMYTWLDAPVKIAGRVITADGGKVSSKLVEFDETFVIPSVAIHYNRTANDGVKFNPQVDMQVLAALGDGKNVMREAEEKADGKVLDYDLFVTAEQKPFKCGFNEEFICAPRLDNLTSVFSSVEALIRADASAIPTIYLADNEEVGSRTKQGAGSSFLRDVLLRVSYALGKTEEEFRIALGNSFFVSCDNAHGVHPNHPELSDSDNKVLLGGGMVIKHHANQNYTTDALSSALFKHLLDAAGVKRQDFFMRSDLAAGGTLGAISSAQLSVRSVDVGLAQLGMHSYSETFASADYIEAVRGLTAVLSAEFLAENYSTVNVKSPVFRA